MICVKPSDFQKWVSRSDCFAGDDNKNFIWPQHFRCSNGGICGALINKKKRQQQQQQRKLKTVFCIFNARGIKFYKPSQQLELLQEILITGYTV